MKTSFRIKLTLSLIATLNILMAKTQSTDCNLTFNFTTVTTNAGFAPNNVLAVWVEDNSNTFIRTLKLNANKRIQYLYTWNDESAGNKVDAVTGATKTSHSAETVTWDGKNTSKAVVPDGIYRLFVEFTEEHSQGPLLIIPFTKNSSNSDSAYNNQTNFVNITLNYTVTNSTGIKEQLSNLTDFSVFPNPVSTTSQIAINMDKDAIVHLSLYSLKGEIIKDAGSVKLSEGTNTFPFIQYFDENILTSGAYLLRLEYNNQIKILKLVKP